MGAAGVAASGLSWLSSCGSKTPSAGEEDEVYDLDAPIPTDRMTMRTNPRQGDRVSLLGYGCMRWPMKTVTNDDGEKEEVLDQETINELVDFALEHGVNYFDTSPAYCRGLSEKVTGIALARHPRKSYYIATKLSNFAPASRTREASIEMYRHSLSELQTDYIDYMLLHSVGGGGDNWMQEFNSRYIDNGILDFLLEERRAGRIRNLGFSYHGNIEMYDYLLSRHEEIHWDFVQIQMNYMDWYHAKNPRNNASYLFAELKKRGIPVVIMEPLLGGRLAKVPDSIVARLKQREPERSVASWAFRFVGSFPEVLCVLSGMTYMDHLKDNLRSFCPLKPLTEEENEFLFATADLMNEYPTIPCNDCKYCMPCPYGIDIPAILLHYNRCVNEGHVPSDSQDPHYRRMRRAFLVGYDRAVDYERQASHCIGCNQCVPHCPQNIRIPQELHRIDGIIEQLKRTE